MDSLAIDKKEAGNMSKQEEECMGRPWSKLPNDVLINVLNVTSVVDQLQLPVVCKDWKLVVQHYVSSLPWLMFYHWRTCKLYDPYHRKIHTVPSGFKGLDVYCLIGAEACYSKHGWVLFSEMRLHGDDKSSSFLFVYSPFADEVIKLPELKMGFDKTTFSSVPTSSDCLFFAVRSKVLDSSECITRISVCHSGDQAWQTFFFHSDCLGDLESILYLNGKLYSIFWWENMVVFDVALQKWHLLLHKPVFPDIKYPWEVYLVDSDGQLLSLVKKSAENTKAITMSLLKFDFLNDCWVHGVNLGNRALFLDSGCFSIQVAGEFADTVNFFKDKRYKRYSFRAGKVIEPADSYFHALRQNENKIWIIPPQLNA